MSKKTQKDYNTIIRTPNIEERNNLISELYTLRKEYYYTDKQKDGCYIVAYNN